MLTVKNELNTNIKYNYMRPYKAKILDLEGTSLAKKNIV